MKRFKGGNLQGSPAVTEGESSNTGISQQMKKGVLLTVGMALVFGSFACGDSSALDDMQDQVNNTTTDNTFEWVDNAPSEAVEEVDGIAYKYSLLNQLGKPANSFKEGENFSFRFEMTNKSAQDDLYFWHNLLCLLTPDGYGTVVSEAGDTTAILYKRINCTFDDVDLHFGQLNHFELNFPNISAFDDDGYLTTGRYSTELAHGFSFDVGKPYQRTYNTTKTISLKLYFIID